MNPSNIFAEKIALPIGDLFMKQSVASSLKFLMESQWWSKDQLVNYQNLKLKELINHAYRNVPYYKNLFDNNDINPAEIKCKDDLVKIPILTKEIIRKNIKSGDLIAKNIPQSKLVHASSSGSTGEPLQYYTTNYAYGFNLACAIRAWYWMGYQLGDRYVKISQYDRSKIKRIQDLLNNSKYLPAKELSEEYFKLIVKSINSFKPKIIRGYPDQMLFLSDYIKANNLDVYTPHALTTTGSTLRMSTRDRIESVFGVPVYDAYRCEGGANVSQCENRESFHSSVEYAITEIISNGKEVNHGEKGYLITTDLQNLAVPFIRYDTQDIVTKGAEKCSCGRHLMTISKIDGRDSDFLLTPSGKFLIDVQFDGWFPEVSSVDQYQIYQKYRDLIIIRLVVNDLFDDKEEKRILSYWQKYIGLDTKVEIEILDEIPLTKSGKRRYLIRDKSIILPL